MEIDKGRRTFKKLQNAFTYVLAIFSGFPHPRVVKNARTKRHYKVAAQILRFNWMAQVAIMFCAYGGSLVLATIRKAMRQQINMWDMVTEVSAVIVTWTMFPLIAYRRQEYIELMSFFDSASERILKQDPKMKAMRSSLKWTGLFYGVLLFWRTCLGVTFHTFFAIKYRRTYCTNWTGFFPMDYVLQIWATTAALLAEFIPYVLYSYAMVMVTNYFVALDADLTKILESFVPEQDDVAYDRVVANVEKKLHAWITDHSKAFRMSRIINAINKAVAAIWLYSTFVYITKLIEFIDVIEGKRPANIRTLLGFFQFLCLGMVCEQGEQLASRTEGLAETAYDPSMFNYPIKIRRKFLMVTIVAANSPVHIAPFYGIMPLTRTTFNAFMNFSYSVVTLIVSTRTGD